MPAQFWTGKGAGMGFPGAKDISAGPPPGMDPFKGGGRVPARWTHPFAGYNQPVLELPQNKSLRITLAINAWLGDPIINSASKLTIFLAFETMLLTVTSRCKTIPKWIPPEEVEKYRADYGDNPGQIAAAYVKQKCLELVEYLDIKRFMEAEALDVLISGDGYVNIVTNALPEEEQAVWNAADKWDTIRRVNELKAKMMQDGRGPYQIYSLQGLNPSAVWLYPDYAGRITNGKVVHLLGEGVWDLNLDNLIHLKSYSWNWVVYGISHYISALKWVDIKFKMMDALYTNAQRYVTPREWLKIRGPEAPENKAALPPTEEQMRWADSILSHYNAGVPFVLPDGWDWAYLGAEGKVLRVENLLEKIDDAIRTGAQVSRTFTSGSANVPAYATSKLQAGIMYKAIKPLTEMAARAIEGRILQRFCLMNGFFEEDGTLIAPKVEFKTMPIQGDDSVEKKIQTLGALGLISPITAWEFEGIDPSLEIERINMARQGMVEPFRALAPDLSPSQTPDRFDELRDDVESINEKLGMLEAAKARGHEKLISEVGKLLHDQKTGNAQGVERATREINRYLTQAHYLQRSDAENRLDHAEDWESQVYRMREEAEVLQDPAHASVLDRAATVTAEVRNPVVRKNGGTAL